MDITLRHLRQIEALVRHGSFAGTARELHISQPALSRSISLLEDRLGVKLFDRSKREVVPTIYGKHLQERGKPILQDMYLMERELNLLQGLESGELVIGSGPMPAEVSLGQAVARFCMKYPKINVQIIVDRTPNLLAKLYSRELDLFVADIRMINEIKELDIIPLPKQKAHFCCRKNHPLSHKKDLAVKDIFLYPMATMWFPDALLKSLARAAGLELRELSELPCAVLQCDYLKVLFDIVSGSDAVGLITRSVLNRSIRKSELVLLPVTVPELNTCYGVVSLSRYSQSTVVSKFQQYLVETDEKLCAEIEI